MSATNKRPDWAFWANMGEVRLWQAIALSLDIEPRWLSASGEPPSAVPGVFDRRPAGFAERLQVAGSHLPSLETFPTWNGLDGAPVRLAIVRRWGESLPVPWTFPSGFPAAEAQDVKRHPRDRGEMVKRGALIDRYRVRWPTIERDLRDAASNGLSAEARADKMGYWHEEAAKAWAERKGKLRPQTTLPTSTLGWTKG